MLERKERNSKYANLRAICCGPALAPGPVYPQVYFTTPSVRFWPQNYCRARNLISMSWAHELERFSVPQSRSQ